MNDNINFALITSDSLREDIKSWDSYQDLDKDQFLDLIDYSKDLINQDPNHEIMFLVVAKGEDSKVSKEKEKEAATQASRKQLRSKSKNILNSIYGV